MLNDHQPDMVALQESKIRNSQALSFRGYEVYRYDIARAVVKGDVALLFKKELAHHYIGVQDVEIDTFRIQINMERGPVQVTSVYLAERMNYLREELLQGHQAKRVEWNSRRNNRIGALLLKDIHDMDGVVIQSNGIREVLDIAILKHVDQASTITTMDYSISDHDPVILGIEGPQEQSYHYKQKIN